MARPRGRSTRYNVCEFCRKRKVKCDKGVPCSACVKYGNPICEYQRDSGTKSDVGEDSRYGSMMQIAPPAKRKKSPSSSTSLSSPNQSTSASGSNMAIELEYLKRQVSLLEKSVSSTDKLSVHRGDHPIWRYPDIEDITHLVGDYPCLSDSQYFSFQNSYVPFIAMGQSNVRHYYPLNWVSLIKLDAALSPMLAYKNMNKRKRANFLRLQHDGSPAETVFDKKLSEFIDEDTDFETSGTKKISSQLNQRAKVVGMTIFEGNLDAENNVVSKALLVLPTKKVIWLLIDRFFARVYPFYPFLDQFDFEGQVTQILGSADRGHVKVTQLHIKKKIHLINLGILLLVLRFAHLTLFCNDIAVNEAAFTSNDPSFEAQQLKFLMNNPVDIDVVYVSQQCLGHLGYLRYANLAILQLCLYLKLYNAYAPENGEGADDSNTRGYTSQLIDIARNLGLHREPDNFRVKIRDERTNNLSRKIWWFLVMHDITGALTNGNSLVIKRCEFDTRTPYHKPGNENNRDKCLENQLAKCYADFVSCYGRIVKVVDGICDLTAPIRMRDLCANLSDLEKSFVSYLEGWTADYMVDSPTTSLEFSKAIQTKVGFESRFFVVSICHHFFNYYEKMDQMNLAYFYLKKIIAVAIYKMMPFYDNFVNKGSETFKNTTEMCITPSYQTLVHKCTIIVHGILIRARFSIMQCEGSPTHLNDLATNSHYKKRYQLLVDTWDHCNICLKVFLAHMQKLGSRYFYSWRYSKVQERLRQIRSGTEFYLSWCKGKETYMKLSNEMLEDLNDMLRNSLEEVNNKQTNDENGNVQASETQSSHSVGTDQQSTPFGMSFNSPATTNPTPPFSETATNSDTLWLQLLSMKPEMNKSSYQGQTPPFDFPLDNNGFNHVAEYDEAAEFLPDDPVAGASFMENLFGDNFWYAV